MREAERHVLMKTDMMFDNTIIGLSQGFNLLANDFKKCNTT